MYAVLYFSYLCIFLHETIIRHCAKNPNITTSIMYNLYETREAILKSRMTVAFSLRFVHYPWLYYAAIVTYMLTQKINQNEISTNKGHLESSAYYFTSSVH